MVPVESDAAGTKAGDQIDRTVAAVLRLMAVDFELPFTDAVTIAISSVAIVPAVAVKLPVTAPAAIVTEAGTVKLALSSDTVTVAPPAGAPLVNVTVHVVAWPDPRLTGIQVKADICASGLINETELVFEAPP